MHVIDLPDWAVERGKALNSFDHIDPKRTALIVIDMQRVFMEPDEVFGNPHAMDIIASVNRVAGAMRDAGGTVIWTRQTVSFDPPLAMSEWQYDLSDPRVRRAVETMVAGTPSHALHPDMAVDPADIIVDKYRYGAFMCPAGALAAALDARGIEMLIIAGTLTNICCESTARDGNMRGYRVIMLADAMAALTDTEHNAALLNLRIAFADVHRTDTACAMLQEARRRAGSERESR